MEFVPRRFEIFIRQSLGEFRHSPHILDIGGGSISRIPCDPDAKITVLDNVAEVLDRHTGVGNVVEKLVGDAQSFDYGRRRFDVAVFWNVLEHVERPDAALSRACAQLSGGGLIVVRGPELGSLKSLITRLTPHFVHVLFYRWVLGFRNAGVGGEPPCHVAHNPAAAREKLIAQIERLGFTIRFEQRYVGDQIMELRRFFPPAYWIYSAAGSILRALTTGRLGNRDSEFIIVGQRSVSCQDEPLPDASDRDRLAVPA